MKILMAIACLVSSAATGLAQESHPLSEAGAGRPQWIVARSTKDLKSLPESATHIVLDGMGDEGVVALSGRKNVLGVRVLVSEGGFTDMGVAALAKLPKLQALHLEGVEGLGLKAARSIQHMSALDEVGLHSVVCDRDFLDAMLELPRLVALDLSKVNGVDDDAVAKIASRKSLKRLSLSGIPGLAEASVARLAALANLEELSLFDVEGLNDSSVFKLRELRKIGFLAIDCRSVTSDGLRALLGMNGLRRLNLSRCALNGGVMLNIPASIEALSFADCAGIDESVGKLIRDRFQSLRQLRIDRSEVTDKGLQPILEARGLEKLELSLCGKVTSEAFFGVSSSFKLREIVLEMCDMITEEDAVKMRKSKSGLTVVVVD